MVTNPFRVAIRRWRRRRSAKIAQDGSSTIQLPDEVLRLICDFSHIPPPERSEAAWDPAQAKRFRQPTLAALMRVNKVRLLSTTRVATLSRCFPVTAQRELDETIHTDVVMPVPS